MRAATFEEKLRMLVNIASAGPDNITELLQWIIHNKITQTESCNIWRESENVCQHCIRWWAIFPPNGVFSHQMSNFPAEWAILLPNGLFSRQIGYPSTIQQRQMGYFPPKWAIFLPNGLFSRQFGYFPPEWTIFPPNGLFYRQIGYFTAK